MRRCPGGQSEIFQTFMDTDIGLGLFVAQPGVEDILAFELQEQFSIAFAVSLGHCGFRRLPVFEAVHVVGAVDHSGLR